MYLYTICVLLLLLKLHHVGSVTHSHTFTEDTTWYYKQLTTEPSLIVEIQFSVVCIEAPHTFRLNFYTTEDNINLQENCSFQTYGQLHNQHLWFPLRSINNDCLKDKNGLLHCSGKTVIQDFKPRRISFSFGKYCGILDGTSLKGLSFNISVSGQRNKTDCVPLRPKRDLNCLKFYSLGSFPNLLGGTQQDAVFMGGTAVTMFNTFPGDCYKFLVEILCYIFSPKCDSMRRVMIPLCRESCWDFVRGREGEVRKVANDNKTDIKVFLDCDYLPTVGSDIECFYKAVTKDT